MKKFMRFSLRINEMNLSTDLERELAKIANTGWKIISINRIGIEEGSSMSLYDAIIYEVICESSLEEGK